MNRRTLGTAMLASLTTVALAACGSTEPASTPKGTTPSDSFGPVTVTDATGKQVTLPAPAQRVVTLEWVNTEDVVTLGVQPVGVADPKGYAAWVTAAPLNGSPVDVGLRTEPSLESVAKAEPDLILGIEGSIPADAVAQMTKIAPVVLLKPADGSAPLEHLRTNFRTTATLLGKSPDAGLKELDAAIAQARTELAAKKGAKYALAYIGVTGNTVDLRMHSARSVAGAVADELGLVNAWPEQGDAAYGIGSLDLEGLSKLPADMTILYWGNKSVPDPVTGTLAKNALWKALPAVSAGRVKLFADGVWMYGGPASAAQLARQFAAAMK